jgi:hypothetical protein
VSEQTLPEMLHAHVPVLICAKGIYPSPAIWINRHGAICMGSIATPPHQTMAFLCAVVAEGCRELIYGMDRFAKPGQGTTCADLLAGAWWDGSSWRAYTIEYQHDPRIVKPIDWDNAFWCTAVAGELRQSGLLTLPGEVSRG